VSNRRKLLTCEDGGSAIEFSLLAAIFLSFFMGVFQLGLALHYGASVRWALETSARSLLIDPTTTQTQLHDKVVAYLADVPGGSGVTVTLAKDSTDPNAKVYNASSSYSYPLSILFLPTYNLTFNAHVVVPTT
jgi:Flp pilus assembly protein TadG